MNCAEIHPLLHAYLDGELDLVRSLEVERHLKTCAACAAKANQLRSLHAAFQTNDLAYPAPASLRKQVRQMADDLREPSPARKTNWLRLWQWLAAGATAVAILAISVRTPTIPQNDLVHEAVADHIRSLMAGHLTDVISSDQHTVKPWFDGKLDFAPDVKDYTAQGFPLEGGRMDYLDDRAVAALVYRHNRHFINVFIWPNTGNAVTAPQSLDYHGYNVIIRDVGGFQYYLVSDMDENGLGQLADLMGK